MVRKREEIRRKSERRTFNAQRSIRLWRKSKKLRNQKRKMANNRKSPSPVCGQTLPHVGRLIRWLGGQGKYVMDEVDLMDRMDGMGQSKNGKWGRTGTDKHGRIWTLRRVSGL